MITKDTYTLELAHQIAATAGPRTNFPKNFLSGAVNHGKVLGSIDGEKEAWHILEHVFETPEQEEIFQNKVLPFFCDYGDILTLAMAVKQISLPYQVVNCIPKDNPSFLYGVNKALLKYDDAKDEDHKNSILLFVENNFHHIEQGEFFTKKLRPFLENTRSVSDFVMKTTDIAVAQMKQKRQNNL